MISRGSLAVPKLVSVGPHDMELNKERIQRLVDVMEEFRKLHPVFTAHQIQTLLLVALNEGLSLNELAELGGTKQSTISRQLIDLSEADREQDKGMGLIERTANPTNYRQNQYLLTPKGKALVIRLLNALWEK